MLNLICILFLFSPSSIKTEQGFLIFYENHQFIWFVPSEEQNNSLSFKKDNLQIGFGVDSLILDNVRDSLDFKTLTFKQLFDFNEKKSVFQYVHILPVRLTYKEDPLYNKYLKKNKIYPKKNIFRISVCNDVYKIKTIIKGFEIINVSIIDSSFPCTD